MRWKINLRARTWIFESIVDRYNTSKIITYWIHSHKLTYTCCEIRLKCRTRPRLSLLAISGVYTVRELHLETRSFERLSKSRPPCLKPEIYIPRMFGTHVWEQTSQRSIWNQHGAHWNSSWYRRYKNQSFHAHRFPSTKDLPWVNRVIRTVSILLIITLNF